jgi:hypothetical protein
MISGQMSGYKTVISKKTPISFKQSTLKNLSGNVAVFVMFSDGENCVIKFAGATESQKSFSELLWTSQFKAIVFVAIGVCALLIIVISVRMFIKSKNDPDD